MAEVSIPCGLPIMDQVQVCAIDAQTAESHQAIAVVVGDIMVQEPQESIVVQQSIHASDRARENP